MDSEYIQFRQKKEIGTRTSGMSRGLRVGPLEFGSCDI